MKTNIPYQSFSKIILRTPLFPVNFTDKILSDEKAFISNLKNIFNTKIVKEAIFLASPELYYELKKYFENEDTKGGKRDKLLFALLKYLLRMSFRPTPFGLFAGFTVGSVGAETDVFLLEREEYKRHTRLDMNYLCDLAHDLASNPEIREKLHFYPNNSIYPLGKNLRYVEYSYHNSRRIHNLVSVDRSLYLEKVIKAASKGVLLEDLRSILDKEGVSKKEGRDYINELLSSQLLLSELDPALTGPEFLEQILFVLNRINYDGEIVSILNNVHQRINGLDQNGIGKRLSGYSEIIDKLNLLKTSINKKLLFQLDMKISAKSCLLNRKILSDTLEAVGVLKKLSVTRGGSRLSEFKRMFYERYGEREIPLPEALDNDIGIVYGNNKKETDNNPLIGDLVFPLKKTITNIPWDSVQSFYLQKYVQALADNSYEVVITDKDLADFECNWDDFPDTFAALVRITENDDGQNIVLEKVGGSGAANLMGRFCHADEKLYDLAREISEKEKSYHPDAIHAEIIHLPQSRTGNILQRSQLRDYEIPYLGKSSLADSRQIKTNDLFVSVRDNRIFLRSQRLNKAIIPRLTTAHNFSNDSLTVYQFLCDLQLQDKVSSISFDWGVHNGEYKFLPQVKYKNVILFLATWNLRKNDVKELLKITDDNVLLKKLDEWRRNKKIPERVVLCDSDNELLIDFKSIICVRMLFSMVKNRTRFQLKEFLFNDNNSVVSGQDGNYTNEIIMSFYKNC